MIRPNKSAAKLLATLKKWDRVDAELQTAAIEYLQQLTDGSPRGPLTDGSPRGPLTDGSPRGPLTHDALTQIKQHLAFDRYATPAAILDAIHA